MKPIIFNTEMVKAILAGRKTQTRRPIKKVLCFNADYDLKDPKYGPFVEDKFGDWHNIKDYSPYKVGDTLYVRETWQSTLANTGDKIINIYRADYSNVDQENLRPWKPSIHMPKEAARIFLKVTSVRVERVQDINIHDCINEGIAREFDGSHYWYKNYNKVKKESMFKFSCGSMRSFHSLWDSVYGSRKIYDKLTKKNKWDYSLSWKNNPWVWVFEYERVEK